MARLQRIWVAYDGGGPAQRGLRLALDVARPLGAGLTIVHVARVTGDVDATPVARDVLCLDDAARWRARLARIALNVDSVRARGYTAVGAMPWTLEQLLASVRPDLVVAGTRGVGRPWDLVRNGAAQYLVERGSFPLLLAGPGALAGRPHINVVRRERAYGLRSLLWHSRLAGLVNHGGRPVLVLPR